MTETMRPSVTTAAGDAPGLPNLLSRQAVATPSRVAWRVKRLGYWHDVTWARAERQAAAAGLGWRAIGVQPGQTVALLSGNRPEWLAADLGAQGVGAITAGLHPASPAAEAARLLDHVGAVAVLVEDASQLELVRGVRSRVPSLRITVVIDTAGIPSLDGSTEMSFGELCALGDTSGDPVPGWRDAISSVSAHNPATIVFSAGSDPPRAVVLSHRNLVQTGRALADALALRPADETVSALPMASVVERVVAGAAAPHAGCVVDFGNGPATLTEDAREAQPTVLVTVPRTWETIRETIEGRISHAAWIKRRAFRYWQRRGAKRAARGKRVSRLGWWLLYRPIWKQFGLQRTRVALSIGAPIGAPVVEFLGSLGMPVRESYGTVETTGFATCPTGRSAVRAGAGTALPGVELRIGTDDEVLVRGPNVFLGYAGDPDRTAAVLGPDGWFHTGDTGTLDADGRLTITGRTKDLIVTATGAAVAPRFLEDRLKLSPYVHEAVIVGDGRPYLTALIDPAEDALASWAATHAVPYSSRRDLDAQPEIRELYESCLDEVNRDLAPNEQVRDLRLLPAPLDQASGQLTTTHRVRREAVLDRYAGLVDEMYRPAAPSVGEQS
jgi:long-chain acyl-CoA synthetase